MAEVCEMCPTRSFLSDEALLTHVGAVHGADEAAKVKKKKADTKGGFMPFVKGGGKKPKDDKAQLAFPSYGAPSYLDVPNFGQLQMRRVVEVDLVGGQLQTNVIQDYTLERTDHDSDEVRAEQQGVIKVEMAAAGSASSYRCKPCSRPFGTADLASKHLATVHGFDKAESVLTFDNIREIMREALKEEYSNANPFGDRIWVWIADLAIDWVVYEVGGSYWKSTYTMTDAGAVTFGDRTQVIPRMTYMPLVDNDDDDA